MRKIRFYGKLFVNGEWVDLNTEVTQFEIPDDIEPFDFFKAMLPNEMFYLITYSEIKE